MNEETRRRNFLRSHKESLIGCPPSVERNKKMCTHIQAKELCELCNIPFAYSKFEPTINDIKEKYTPISQYEAEKKFMHGETDTLLTNCQALYFCNNMPYLLKVMTRVKISKNALGKVTMSSPYIDNYKMFIMVDFVGESLDHIQILNTIALLKNESPIPTKLIAAEVSTPEEFKDALKNIVSSTVSIISKLDFSKEETKRYEDTLTTTNAIVTEALNKLIHMEE